MIDKSIRQYYDIPNTKKIEGQLHRLAYITAKEAKALKKMGGKEVITDSGIPAYPPPGERGGPGSGSEGRSPGGGEGGGNIHRDPPHITAPTVTYRTPTPTRNIHVDTPEIKAEQDKLDIQQMIAKQQEEKYGDTADPTKFGETISDIARVTSIPEDERTIEDKLVIEDWEKEQDWDKVKDLADRGESSEDIQKAMDKGLLLKEDAVRRKGLIERGLAAVMPKTKLESNLLGSLKKTFDPKRMATNFALKKLGLGWLNPVAGLASLFFPKQTAAVKSKFGLGRKQPVDMSAFKNLGLYADRQPTGTTQRTALKARDAYKQPVSTQIAKGTGLQSGAELLGISPELQKLMAKGKSYSETDIIPSKHKGANLVKFASDKKNFPLHGKIVGDWDKGLGDFKYQQPKEWSEQDFPVRSDFYPGNKTTTRITGTGKNTVADWLGTTKYSDTRWADGGRIDKALGGRSRDI